MSVADAVRRINRKIPTHIYEKDYFFRDCLEAIKDRDREDAVNLVNSMNEKNWGKLCSTSWGRSYLAMLMHITNKKNKIIGCGIKPRQIINMIKRWDYENEKSKSIQIDIKRARKA